ncbi:MAG: murein biosynthesis integral membrane protein MurJ [Deltaproteobacteria bacterium]
MTEPEPSPAPPLPAPSSANAAAQASGNERRSIVRRAGIVATGTLASRILGLGREQVLAASFNRFETDAFAIAFLLPNLLRQLLAEGAVQTGVLPVLAATRERDGDAATRDLFRRLRGLSLAILALVSVLGVWAAPWLVEVSASGFHQHAGQFERTVELTRWLFPYIFFMGSAALGLAALNTYHRYVATAFAPGLLNVSFILCAWYLPGLFLEAGRDRMLALAAGVLIGGALQVIAQWPSLRAIGMLALPRLDLKHAGVREVLRRLGPASLGVGVYYVDVLLGRQLLSGLPVGATSYFTFALRLCDFPQGIFIMALQAATLPSLSRLAARGDRDELGSTFAFGMRLSLFVAIPASVLLVALAEPIVVLIFQRGQFDATASRETAYALAAQGLGVWAVSAGRQLVSAYYALGDTRTPPRVAILGLIVLVAVALGLRPVLGHVGIGLAVTAASCVRMGCLWWLLDRRLPSIDTRGVLRSGAATLLAALPAAAVAWWLARLLTVQGANAWHRLLPGAAASSAFAVVFLASAGFMKHKELGFLLRAVRRRRG